MVDAGDAVADVGGRMSRSWASSCTVFCTEWQRPTCLICGKRSASAQVLIAIGLTYCIKRASGQTAAMSSATRHRCGTVRRPRMMPPTPSVSAMVWRRPWRLGISKSVMVQGS